MSAIRGQSLILAMGSQDDFVHVYQNDKDLLADNAIGPGPGQFSGPVEFFDSDGQRFAGAHDRQGNLLALNPTADPPNLPALVQRVRNAFDRVRSYVDDHPEESEQIGTAVQDALARLPRLSTSADLREFLQVFVSQPASEIAGSDIIGEEPGRTGHNLAHRAGWNHG